TDNRMNGYFKMMQESIHKLDDTLKEILDYSRNARSALNVTAIDIKKMVEENFDRLQYMEGSEGIAKSVEAEADAPFHTDAYRLSAIINNLLSNAIKYRDATKEHSILHVKATVSERQLTLVIRDNGIGIDEDY